MPTLWHGRFAEGPAEALQATWALLGTRALQIHPISPPM